MTVSIGSLAAES